ncbi:MAG: DUF4364 family protein [Lachnospiraceae bacterium]|jgi:DNA-binding PadR family transcriptional regulator|nr:DUF4364 family protein [Lachnospiraceae bacterium]
MLSDPITLYKLMALYMLRQAKFPLTNSQMTDFFLDHGYASYFTLQQVLSELQETGLVTMQAANNTSRYEITKEGDEAISHFLTKISAPAREDIDAYLKKNRLRIRNEMEIISHYYKHTSSAVGYVVQCEIKEGKNTLISMDLAVPDEEQAKQMSDRWKAKACHQDVYAYVMKALLDH